MTWHLGGILLYVALQLAIGWWVSRRIITEDDYLLAGRRLGFTLCSVSVFATWFGAETCVSAAGGVYEEGISVLTVEPFAYGACLLVAGAVFVAPLWRRGITTIADFLRQRFSPGVERLAAVLLIPTSVFWAAAQIRAFGQVLDATSGLDLFSAIAVAAALATVYTTLGGLLADVITDLIQAGALVVGLIVLFAGVTTDLGGTGGLLERVGEARLEWLPAHASWLDVAEAWALPVCGSVLAQEILSRSLAARSAVVARRAVLAGGGLYVLVGLLPVTLGLVGGPLVGDLDHADAYLATLARDRLPAALFVLFGGALVSAILSTVDSALLVAASILSRNLLLAGREASQATRVSTARAGVVGLGIAAWLLAWSSDSVFGLIESASGFGSAGVLVVVAFGLTGRIGGAASAWAALLAGVLLWCAGYLGMPYPFLASLTGALLAYSLAAVVTSRRR